MAPVLTEGVFATPTMSEDSVVVLITSGFINYPMMHRGEVNVMAEPFRLHRLEKGITHS